MPLTFRLKETYQLPADGEWVEMRMPSKTILDKARTVKARSSLALMKDVDMGALRDAAEDIESSVTPGGQYDWQTLFAECFTAWSFEEPMTAENIAELDEASVDYLLAQIFPAETVDERKKGLEGSTNGLTETRAVRRRSG